MKNRFSTTSIQCLPSHEEVKNAPDVSMKLLSPEAVRAFSQAKKSSFLHLQHSAKIVAEIFEPFKPAQKSEDVYKNIS